MPVILLSKIKYVCHLLPQRPTEHVTVVLCPCWQYQCSPWKFFSDTAAERQTNKKALIELLELPEHALGTQSLRCYRINFSLEIICDLNAFYRLRILMTSCLMAH